MIGFQKLFVVVAGKSDNFIRAQNSTGDFVREVALPDMQAVGIDRQEDIQPVIDDEGNARASQNFLDPKRRVVKIPRGRFFFSQLDYGYASAHRFMDDAFDGSAECQPGIGHQI